MLKKRVIPSLLYKRGRLVKGVNFSNFRETGLPHTAVRIYSSQDADELLLMNIDFDITEVNEFDRLVGLVAEESMMPLTIGGGICDLKRISHLIRIGADKVVLNSSVYDNYRIIREAAAEFGSQAISVGVDFKRCLGKVSLFSGNGSIAQNVSLSDHIEKIQDAGAGEMILTSIDRDGTMSGYDLEILSSLESRLAVPLVISGGAGNFQHLSEALKFDFVSGVACGSLFHFADNNPIRARSHLKNQGIAMRVLK